MSDLNGAGDKFHRKTDLWRRAVIRTLVTFAACTPSQAGGALMRIKKIVVLSAALLLLFSTMQAQEQVSEVPEPLRYTRVYADSTGASHFSDEEMALALINPGPRIPPTPASVPIDATGMIFLCPPADGVADWHPAPGRQINILLSGAVEVEMSDGEVRQFGTGSVILLEDASGKGHRTRVLGSERTCFVGVSLEGQ